MTLRDEIVQIIFKDWLDHADLNDTADSILALIDSQRCEWTIDDYEDEDVVRWMTGCNKDYFVDGELNTKEYPYCPCCGKPVHVVDISEKRVQEGG